MLQRIWPEVHAEHVPSALQSAADIQGEPMGSQPFRLALQRCGCGPAQLVCPGVQVGVWQLPPTQRASVAHGIPSGTKAVRPGLQSWGCPSTHRLSPTAHTGVRQEALAAWHRSGVAHGIVVVSFQAVRSPRHRCGCAPTH